jgi:voltage-gated potassium channel
MPRRAPLRQILLLFARRLRLPVTLFVLFHVVVITIYMTWEGVRWDDALFWITHPHAIHPEQVSTSTKLLATVVFTGVFFFQVWFAERVLSALFAPGSMEAWAMIKNQLDVAKMRDHFIVCGYGQVGRTVVDQLRKAQIPFVLIETDEDLCKDVRREGVPVVRGDAKRRGVLSEAGIERAKGICVLIDNDADNLYITITARSLNPNAKILMRAGQRRYAEAMRSAGADEVIIPEYEGGLMVSRLVEKYAGRSPGAGPEG